MLGEEKRPVLSGFVALLAVGVVIGLLIGLGTLFGVRMAGLDDGAAGSTRGASNGETLFLPSPEPTRSGEGPLVTLAPGESPSSGSTAQPTKSAEEPKKKQITLDSGVASVEVLGRIPLSGIYRDGEGAILQVQRKEGGKWADFPVTVGVSGGTFTTYIQTGHTGVNELRVYDSGADLASNVVRVTVG